MNQNTKDKLKALPKTKCAKCGSAKFYANPMAKCFGCGRKFCFDHITGGVEIKGQNPNEELKDICDFCLPKLKV
jgi:hypothetical protein